MRKRIALLYGGRGKVENGIFSTGLIGFNPDLPEIPYDVEAAKALLSEAGYPDGFEMELCYSSDSSQTTKDLCLELLNMGAWAQLYFNHNISNLANTGYDIQPANPVPDEIPTVQRTGKVDGITFYGTSVRFLYFHVPFLDNR